jgi:hypothetical protein
LQAGTIDHMLLINLPDDMPYSVSSSADQLAANAWPQTMEDGNGPTIYTGTVPYGVTMGIPSTAVEPADVKANAGANMLWQEMRDHGAMIRNSGGGGNNVTFPTDQSVNPSDPGHGAVWVRDHGAGANPGQPGTEQHQRRRHTDRAA